MYNSKNISKYDPDVYEILKSEEQREQTTIDLIASENFTSFSVLEMAGSVMTNKYAEGYPGKRYYGGCEFVDQIENIANSRLSKLFNAKYTNVQPHSGSQANMAVFIPSMIINFMLMRTWILNWNKDLNLWEVLG